MTCVTVTTQTDLDTALAGDGADCIHIESPKGVWLEISSVPDGKEVEVHGSASVRAWGSASVRASGSASVRASGSASVRASGSASVRASKFVAVHLHSARVKVEGGVLIDMTELDLTDLDTWLDYTGAQVVDGRVVLYKAVDANLNAGHCYRLTAYAVGGTMTCPDWRDDNECGGGYHLSPTAAQATDYYDGAKRWLRCTAALADVRPIGEIGQTAKCKVRELTVEAEVDIHDRDLPARDLAEVAS